MNETLEDLERKRAIVEKDIEALFETLSSQVIEFKKVRNEK